MLQVWQDGSHDKRLSPPKRRNSKKQQELASKVFKKAMKATWGETSDEESEGEDGESNMTLIAKSDTDSDSDSSEQISVEKIEILKIFSSLKYEYKFLKREKIESENAIKTLNAEINNLEETVSVQKIKNSKLKEIVLSLKAELNTIKERKTSSNEINDNDQVFHEAKIASLKKEL
ncbi:hypothetical protein HAX54_016202 [Datura stramonium]|uniref:Uncharacterized protein n=1 Tax=Datura stramonium TaxID=4076 RepID=A0ABS8UJ57_DATST|nr:hypothetical protein [Datura stramonium]